VGEDKGVSERVRVEIPVKPTEDLSILTKMLRYIIEPDEVLLEESGIERVLIAKSRCLSSLSRLRNSLRRERILDAARKSIRINEREEKIEFLIHKQALAANRISLVDSETESPLGAVRIIIYHPNPRKVLEWIAPKTRYGKPIKEIDVPDPDCI
jgi:predicted RNA binding protein with dsRBD fold (UPF0201 family)